MLRLDNRQVLLAALTPPAGYAFDCGICTTYSLDLPTLLVAPLSLTLLDVASVDSALRDPVLVLEGLQRHAEQLAVFCQAGQIAIPATDSYLFRFLEGMVVEVQAPYGGVFHPKVWLLRYTATDQPVLYRFLCMTRNMTLDRSWDILVRLDGQVAERQYAYSKNHPLGDFIASLQRLAVRPPGSRISKDIARLAEEVRYVAFTPPQPFSSLSFHPSGIAGHRRLSIPRGHRRLILSPFLSDGVLREATAEGAGHILISRLDSLDAVDRQVLSGFESVYFFDDEVAGEDSEKEEQRGGPDALPASQVALSGLHAKLLVCDHGWDSTWLVGSANATEAAFRGKNVEFMVALSAKRSKAGVEQVLGPEGEQASLRALLRDYRALDPSRRVIPPPRYAEDLANAVRDWLVRLALHTTVVQQGDDVFDLRIGTKKKEPAPEGVYTIDCWPISLPPAHRLSFPLLPQEEMVIFPRLSLLALTPFLAFTITAQAGGQEHTLRFVLNLPLAGMPEMRDDQVLCAIISDRAAFIRYLRLLLAGVEENLLRDVVDWGLAEAPGTADRLPFEDTAMPLLEDLIRAFSRAPEKLNRAAALIEHLRHTPQGRAVLPEGFEGLWEALQKARGETDDD